jgi:hypothetical protein
MFEHRIQCRFVIVEIAVLQIVERERFQEMYPVRSRRSSGAGWLECAH